MYFLLVFKDKMSRVPAWPPVNLLLCPSLCSSCLSSPQPCYLPTLHCSWLHSWLNCGGFSCSGGTAAPDQQSVPFQKPAHPSSLCWVIAKTSATFLLVCLLLMWICLLGHRSLSLSLPLQFTAPPCQLTPFLLSYLACKFTGFWLWVIISDPVAILWSLSILSFRFVWFC